MRGPNGAPTFIMKRPPIPTAGDTRFIPWIVAAALFMQTLDSSILNTALPGIARDLMVSPLRMRGMSAMLDRIRRQIAYLPRG